MFYDVLEMETDVRSIYVINMGLTDKRGDEAEAVGFLVPHAMKKIVEDVKVCWFFVFSRLNNFFASTVEVGV